MGERTAASSILLCLARDGPVDRNSECVQEEAQDADNRDRARCREHCLHNSVANRWRKFGACCRDGFACQRVCLVRQHCDFDRLRVAGAAHKVAERVATECTTDGERAEHAGGMR